MFSRVLATVAALTVALVAAAVIECTNPALELVGGDPVGICSTAGWLGDSTGLWVGVGLGAFALLAIVAIWVPSMRPGASRRMEPESSLRKNLDRISDGEEKEPSEPTPASDVHAIRLIRRLEAIEASIRAESFPAREVTEKWMSLLRDANALHNNDDLATDDFKEINTRLLDLFAESSDETGDLAAGQ